MSGIKVEVIDLEPLRFASFYSFGPSPEFIAFEKLEKWAKPLGYLDDRDKHRIFGFNNPNPSAGSPNYGYEFWIEVGPEIEPDGDMRLIEFKGGKYAVTSCPVPEDDIEVISTTWHKLATWLEDSPYRYGSHQWLEKHLPSDASGILFVLELMIPISN
jgi:DNA gyrase inhibitor GyrI